MTVFARLLTIPSDRRWNLGRGLGLLLGLTACVIAAHLLVPASSQAHVAVIGGKTVGSQPREVENLFDGRLTENELGEFEETAVPQSFSNGAGNPVVHGSNIYAVYWDPTDHYHGDWQKVINHFLRNLGVQSNSLSSVFSVDAQYTDVSNQPAFNRQTFRGAYPDTHPYPAAGCADPHPLQTYPAQHTGPLSCLTDEQVSQELQGFITAHGLPTGMNTIYYVLTPPGVAVCLDGGGAAGHCSDFEEGSEESYKHSFCSYHSDLNPNSAPLGDASTVLYGVVPWTAGGLGDGQLREEDQTTAFFCQDGGFDPTSKPIEKPGSQVQQEPNQVKCPSPDGYCDTGLADLIINQIAVEQQNIVTNPLLNSWTDSSGNELTDECRNFFAPAEGSRTAVEGPEAGNQFNQSLGDGKYYVNTAFNLAALRLVYPGVPCLHDVSLDPKFTAPNTVNAGDIVGFDGMESNITLDSAIAFEGPSMPKANYATYSWDFGDGSPTVSGFAPGAPSCETPWLSPCAAGVFHSYTYGGTYQVTLTATDVAGNTASVTQPVVVVGPPAPSPVPTPGPAPGPSSSPAPSTTTTGAAGTASSTTGQGGHPSGGTPSVPAPVAAAAAVSRSLRSIARRGLVIRYSVNEQVAGHFDVLLSRTLARRLGIGGAPAVGLAAGTPQQVVIGKAILVTTAAGRSSVTIHFSKRTASRLARLRSVTLMIRLTVRNAASHSPATTTVLSTITLTR